MINLDREKSDTQILVRVVSNMRKSLDTIYGNPRESVMAERGSKLFVRALARLYELNGGPVTIRYSVEDGLNIYGENVRVYGVPRGGIRTRE